MKIGDKIRFIRDKERNFTQAYVAEQLGITTKAYGNIENNQSDPSYSKLLKIADILECDINYIINYENKKKRQLLLQFRCRNTSRQCKYGNG